jgi:hypothetical protein
MYRKKLRSLCPNFYIHVSVSDLYISTIGPPIFLQQNRQTDISEYLFRIFVYCLCSAEKISSSKKHDFFGSFLSFLTFLDPDPDSPSKCGSKPKSDLRRLLLIQEMSFKKDRSPLRLYNIQTGRNESLIGKQEEKPRKAKP